MSRKGELCFKRRAHQALRAQVYQRDAFRCVHCGWAPPTVPVHYDGRYTLLGSIDDGGRMLQVDHVIALARGGMNVVENLQTLCSSCNASKCDRELPRAA